MSMAPLLSRSTVPPCVRVLADAPSRCDRRFAGPWPAHRLAHVHARSIEALAAGHAGWNGIGPEWRAGREVGVAARRSRTQVVVCAGGARDRAVAGQLADTAARRG